MRLIIILLSRHFLELIIKGKRRKRSTRTYKTNGGHIRGTFFGGINRLNIPIWQLKYLPDIPLNTKMYL